MFVASKEQPRDERERKTRTQNGSPRGSNEFRQKKKSREEERQEREKTPTEISDNN